MNPTNYTKLTEYLKEIPDPRSSRGQSHVWIYVLTIVCLGLLSGETSIRGIVQWAYNNREELLAELKPKRMRVPSASTLYRAVRNISLEKLEEQVARYTQSLDENDKSVGKIETLSGKEIRGQSVDGKTVRGASKRGNPCHLVSVVRHDYGTVLSQEKVDVKTNEITVVPQVLSEVSLEGTVTTMDALLTQRKIAQQIVDAGGDYLMVVKMNQPTLYESIKMVFDSPPIPVDLDEFLSFTYSEKGHGRIETRTLESTIALTSYLDWPGNAQVMRRTRRAIDTTTGEVSNEVHYGITSVDRTHAFPKQLEQLWRAHWTIENCVHYVRDVSMGEDSSSLRSDNAPQAMAAFRNAILSLLRFEGWNIIPDAFRFFSANLPKSVQIIGALET